MSDFNEPAYPVVGHFDKHGLRGQIADGLTIRQQAVLMAMQSLIAQIPFDALWSIEDLAKMACETADAVLRAERESRDE